ncbi:MAG TPA: VOC family protein [Spongiibacteraceae bacterium]|nr:VOC family protein [Spongiibacteraceae bacterium]
MQLNPYLIFNDQCEEAFKFYEKCLGGKIEGTVRGRDTPMADKMPAASLDKIMHMRLVVDGKLLMGSDAMANGYRAPQGMSVTLSIEDPAEAERVYKALSVGGKIEMELQETFWAVRFGTFTDRFGIPWMVNCEKTVG